MGPNGSGKTMLVRALVGLIRVVCTPWSPQGNPVNALMTFLSNTALRQRMSFHVEFEADWLERGRAADLFRYELAVSHIGPLGHDNQIVHEALYYFPNGRRRRLFERGMPGESIYVARELGITPKDDRLKAVRDNSSVIATLAVLNVPLALRIATTMQTCLLCTNVMFFENWTPPTETVVALFEQNADMRRRVKREIQRSDLAIRDVDTVPGRG